MKINETIRSRRKQLGLTQEQVANRLGVTATAVYKWESASCYPDITLLPALARLLGVDLNTLLCFQEDLTDEEISAFANEVFYKMQQEGFAAGFALAMQRVREYPNCDRLLSMIGGILKGGMVILAVPQEEQQPYREEIDRIYRRLLNSEDEDVRRSAYSMTISDCIAGERFEQAQQLLDELPKRRRIDAEELQATLCIAQKEYAKAREILEKKIYYTMNNQVMGCLLSLMDIAVREGKMEDAKRLADISSKGAEVFELWEYNRYSPYLQLSIVEQDKERCFELLNKMFSLLGQDWKLADTLLYRDIPQKGEVTELGALLTGTILKSIRESGEADFLVQDERFEELERRFQKVE